MEDRNFRRRFRRAMRPPVREPRHAGFGSRLIKFRIAHDLGGSVEQQSNLEGLRVRLEFPIG